MYGVTGVAGVKYSSATRDEEGGGKSTFVADDGGTTVAGLTAGFDEVGFSEGVTGTGS